MKKEQRTKQDDTPVKIEASSGNVFADLGLKNPDELLAKAELVQRICDIIAQRKLTQSRTAKLLGIDQPKVSALMRGKLSGFSTDRLFRFLNALGSDVEIVIRPARLGQGGRYTRRRSHSLVASEAKPSSSPINSEQFFTSCANAICGSSPHAGNAGATSGSRALAALRFARQNASIPPMPALPRISGMPWKNWECM